MGLNEEEMSVLDHLCLIRGHENLEYLNAYIVDSEETLHGLEDRGLIRSFANNKAFALTECGKKYCNPL